MLFASITYSQVTLIPDPNFEQYLLNAGIDTDGIINGQVLTADIEDELTLIFLLNPITDLTGIEDFMSLEYLDIQVMDIEDINLNENLNLKRLDIEDVSLISLDLSNNIALEELHLSLNISGGQYASPISTLDLSSNTLLSSLSISRVNLSFLGLSNNSNITSLRLNSLEDLIDVNLKNGNNEQLVFLRLTNSFNLECVQVDDPLAVIAGTNPPYDNWIIENNPTITDDCMLGFEQYLTSQINVYPNPVKDILTIDNNELIEIKKITVYDMLGKEVLIENTKFHQLNLSTIKSGVLFLLIETNNGVTTKKVIKEND